MEPGSTGSRGREQLGQGDGPAFPKRAWEHSEKHSECPGLGLDDAAFCAVGASLGTAETKLPLEVFRNGNIISMWSSELPI